MKRTICHFSLVCWKSKHLGSHGNLHLSKSWDVSWETKCMTNLHVHPPLCHTCLIVLSNLCHIFASESQESYSANPFKAKEAKTWHGIMTSRLSTNLKCEFLHSVDCGAKIARKNIWLARAQKLRWWDGSKFSFTQAMQQRSGMLRENDDHCYLENRLNNKLQSLKVETPRSQLQG